VVGKQRAAGDPLALLLVAFGVFVIRRRSAKTLATLAHRRRS
jgi:hypothetical protein